MPIYTPETREKQIMNYVLTYPLDELEAHLEWIRTVPHLPGDIEFFEEIVKRKKEHENVI